MKQVIFRIGILGTSGKSCASLVLVERFKGWVPVWEKRRSCYSEPAGNTDSTLFSSRVRSHNEGPWPPGQTWDNVSIRPFQLHHEKLKTKQHCICKILVNHRDLLKFGDISACTFNMSVSHGSGWWTCTLTDAFVRTAGKANGPRGKYSR